jgi:hypothetical protein
MILENLGIIKDPDILDYMQKSYKDLNIQFLPDNIIQQAFPSNY